MERQFENKIVLVKRKTRLEELIARFNTIAQARFYIERLGADFSDYVLENENYHQALSETENSLKDFGRVHVMDRYFLPNFIFSKDDVVVAIGQDGMVANTLKYLNEQVLVGINPDPKRWDGVLLPFQSKDLVKIIPELFAGKRPIQEISMAKATLNDGQTLYAVNDLFVGQKTHVSARYEIRYQNVKEKQSSSGIIVSTGLGSTGWFKSVLTGAVTISSQWPRVKTDSKSAPKMDDSIKSKTKTAGVKQESALETQFSWDSDYLYFSVREPFPSKSSAASAVFGKVSKKEPLILISQMPENGVIFSDGIESDFLNFNSGIEAKIQVAEKKGKLVL